MKPRRIAVPLGFAALALVLGACGGSSGANGTSNASQPAASSADFPSPKGKSLLQLKQSLGPGPVLAPTVSVVMPGRDRYGFGPDPVAVIGSQLREGEGDQADRSQAGEAAGDN